MRQAVLIAVVLLVAGAMAPATDSKGRNRSFVRSYMETVAEVFRGIESALESDERGGVRSAAKQLVAILEQGKDQGIAARVSDDSEATRGFDRVHALAKKLAKSENPLLDFENLRRACIQCHGRFRESDRCEYPSTAGKIVGRVQIRNSEGQSSDTSSDVVVFLEAESLKKMWDPPAENPVISQKNRQFSPRVLPVVVGTTVAFPNDDSILHNAFSLSKPKTFDLEIFRPGESGTVTFDKTGLVRVYCNIHPHMNSSILVLENPYFAMTDHAGRFVIPEVPAGDYVLRVWNSLGAQTRRPVSVEKLKSTHVDLDAQETIRSIKHNDKHGRPYREKY